MRSAVDDVAERAELGMRRTLRGGMLAGTVLICVAAVALLVRWASARMRAAPPASRPA